MFNRVVLLGTVGPRGVEVRPRDEGSMVATFMLTTSDTNPGGRTFTTWHVVEAYGKALASAETLEPGDIVLLDGTLRRRKVGEAWESIIVAWQVQRVMRAVAVER